MQLSSRSHSSSVDGLIVHWLGDWLHHHQVAFWRAPVQDTELWTDAKAALLSPDEQAESVWESVFEWVSVTWIVKHFD